MKAFTFPNCHCGSFSLSATLVLLLPLVSLTISACFLRSFAFSYCFGENGDLGLVKFLDLGSENGCLDCWCCTVVSFL